MNFLTSAKPSRICLHINGSVCINNEQVFLLSSLCLLALLCLEWPSFASLEYLLCVSVFTSRWLRTFLRTSLLCVLLFKNLYLLLGCITGIGGGSSTPEAWTCSIHWRTSSLIPQPGTWPIRNKSLLEIMGELYLCIFLLETEQLNYHEINNFKVQLSSFKTIGKRDNFHSIFKQNYLIIVLCCWFRFRISNLSSLGLFARILFRLITLERVQKHRMCELSYDVFRIQINDKSSTAYRILTVDWFMIYMIRLNWDRMN